MNTVKRKGMYLPVVHLKLTLEEAQMLHDWLEQGVANEEDMRTMNTLIVKRLKRVLTRK